MNVAPFPSGLFCAHILPPCTSTIFFEINNPNPVPENDFVVNFENNLGSISGSIPCPVSYIVVIASLSFTFDTIDIVPSAVNLRALGRRFEIT